MTDKQTINEKEAIKMIKKLNEKLKNVDDYVVELRSNFYRMKQDLDRKEQECEELKAKLELFKTSNQTTIDQLKAENEDLKKSILQECPNCGEEYLNYKGAALYFENSDLKQTLAEIKPILEYYANSTIGYKTKDGLYRIELSYKYGYSNSCGEPCYYEYNPKPAKEALRKINEVEDDNTRNI